MILKDQEPDEKKSKSQAKREMTALQELGERLAALPADIISKLNIEQELKEAVSGLKKMSKKEAIRRQMQYIGVLMRETNPGAVKTELEKLEKGQHRTMKLFKKAETWRDRLCEGDDALETEIIDNFPEIDIQQFRQHIRNAKREKERQTGNKAARILFRYIKDTLAKNIENPEKDSELQDEQEH